MNRYGAIARAMGADPFAVLATAAVRDAANGPQFLAALRARLPGVPITVLTGEAEAEMSAAGLLCGIPGAHGLLADIGGGSLELVRLDRGQWTAARTLRLGVIWPNAPAAMRRARACHCRSLDWPPNPGWRRWPGATSMPSAAPGGRWHASTSRRPTIR